MSSMLSTAPSCLLLKPQPKQYHRQIRVIEMIDASVAAQAVTLGKRAIAPSPHLPAALTADAPNPTSADAHYATKSPCPCARHPAPAPRLHQLPNDLTHGPAALAATQATASFARPPTPATLLPLPAQSNRYR